MAGVNNNLQFETSKEVTVYVCPAVFLLTCAELQHVSVSIALCAKASILTLWLVEAMGLKGSLLLEMWKLMVLLEDLLRGVYAYGYESPSAVQSRAIMQICKGRGIKRMVREKANL